MTTSCPLIFGLEGPQITPKERAFFTQVNPFGFILYRWNLVDPKQIRTITRDLKDMMEREDLPILIDAEGGRVFRLPEDFYDGPPPAAFFGTLYDRDPEEGLAACEDNGRAIGQTLKNLGFTVNCAPLLDLQVRGAHTIIGDRSFSENPKTVRALGEALIRGLHDRGITPVIKHLPGHGPSEQDSHETLPRVSLSRADLESHFQAFQVRAPKGAPVWGMTAHIVYEAIDPSLPATFSKPVIETIIRKTIGFQGHLLSDDLYMDALKNWTPAERVRLTLDAGCDIALYARGGIDVYEKAIQGLP